MHVNNLKQLCIKLPFGSVVSSTHLALQGHRAKKSYGKGKLPCFKTDLIRIS